MFFRRLKSKLCISKYKNDKIIKSEGTAQTYQCPRDSLWKFTQHRYNTPLSRYHFTDITQEFIGENTPFLGKETLRTATRSSSAILATTYSSQTVCKR